MEESRGLEGLGELPIQLILSKLDPNDTSKVCCVSKRFNDWASDDDLWRLHSSNDLNLSSPFDPSGKPVSSFKVAYQQWREAFSMYPWTLLKRVKSCWDTLTCWLHCNFTEAMFTLRAGASEEQLNEVEKTLKLKLPLPTRLLYRLHDGQECSNEGSGLVGGYSMYDHLVNVFLLPINMALIVTKHLMHTKGFSSRSKYICVAASVSINQKFFSLSCADNQLYVGTLNLREEGEMIPCVPNELLKSNGNLQYDGLLLWLEEHGRRLQNGMVAVREEGGLKTICQFPEKPPLCSTAVTNGVQVRASAVLVPEQSIQNSNFVFAYSIRMSLLPDGCSAHGMKMNSCQLHRRQWIIRENEVVTDTVAGEAVIGMYPLLCAGEKEFVYESCTNQSTGSGSIEGSFTFVPGRLVSPKGDPFEAVVARFPVVLPEYIF